MRKIIIIFIAMIAIFFTSCQKDVIETNDDQFLINNDSIELQDNITYPNKSLNFKNSSLQFTLVGEAQSPVVNGVRLSASYVLFRNNRVYVTFLEQGNGYGGAVVVYDINNPSLPVPISQMTFGNIDINACDISKENNKLYLAGSSKSKGAVIIPLDLNIGIVPSVSQYGTIKQTLSLNIIEVGEGASANGIIQSSQWLYVTAGNSKGGLYCLNKNTYNIVEYDLYSGAKFSTANGRNFGDKHISLEVQPNKHSYIHVHTVGLVDHNLELIWPVGNDEGKITSQNLQPNDADYNKYTIFADNEYCYVSSGKYGLKIYDYNNGELVCSSPSTMITNGNTHAVYVDNQYIYIANGTQGLYVADKVNSNNELNIVGMWDDSTELSSVNMVVSNNTNIFLAKGKEGGLKILKKN